MVGVPTRSVQGRSLVLRTPASPRLSHKTDDQIVAALVQAPEESRGRFDEALDFILAAWTNDSFSFDGKYFQARDLTLGRCS